MIWLAVEFAITNRSNFNKRAPFVASLLLHATAAFHFFSLYSCSYAVVVCVVFCVVCLVIG